MGPTPRPQQPADYWSQFQPLETAPPIKGINPGEPGTPNTPGTSGPIIPGQDTQGPPVTGQPPAAQGNGSRQTFGQQWTSSGGRTVADLQGFVSRWNAANPGAQVTLGGSKGDKVYGPGGQYWADAVISSGINGGQGATWNEDEGGGAASPGGGAQGTGFGDYTAPFTERYSLPTLDELQAMPGYQAGLKAYQGGIETSAASKGTLLTGGTLQRLGQAGTDYANQAYGQLAGLQGNAFNTNYGIFRNNQQDPFNKYLSLANLGR